MDLSLHQQVEHSLMRAVARTVRDQPQMQVGIFGSTKRSPVFVKIDSIDLDHHIEWRVIPASEDYASLGDSLLTESVDKQFTELTTRPGWKVTALRHESAAFIDVMFTFRHAFGDGTGARIFHECLLNHLNNSVTGSNIPGLHDHILKISDADINFPPPLDGMCKWDLSPKYVVSECWKELKPPAFANKPTAIHQVCGPLVNRKTKTGRRTVVVDAAIVQKLTEDCRAHGTTVTGFLHGVTFAFLVAKGMWKDNQPLSIIGNTAINTRRFMPSEVPGSAGKTFDPHKLFANILTTMDHHFDEEYISKLMKEKLGQNTDSDPISIYEEIVWAVAKKTREDLAAKLKMGLKNDQQGLAGLVGNWYKERQQVVKKPRSCAWQITNLGRFDGSSQDESGWRIKRSAFSLYGETDWPTFVISSLTVDGGDMGIDVAFHSGVNDNMDRLGSQLPIDISNFIQYMARTRWGVEYKENMNTFA